MGALRTSINPVPPLVFWLRQRLPGASTRAEKGSRQMKSIAMSILVTAVFVAAIGIASAQTPPATIDGYIGAAKIAAGTDWAGTFLRLCIPPPASPPAG